MLMVFNWYIPINEQLAFIYIPRYLIFNLLLFFFAYSLVLLLLVSCLRNPP